MKIVFTLCSNNYLAQAKSLGDSLKEKNPDYLFFIGLLDIINDEIDYETEIGHPLILSNEIGIQDFDDLWKKYNIIEFNTCVKPFYFQYFIKTYGSLEYLFYLDPDTLVYDNINIIESEFGDSAELLLTPHILSPIPLDNKTPGENMFLNYGVYNLGFLGLKNPERLGEFLDWWKERTYQLGYDQTDKGLFVDQLWFNLVPLFFKNVKISKHPGLNMAPWNLHERKLTNERKVLFLDKSFPLVFYHFSKYNLSLPDQITNNFNRYNFDNNIDLQVIYKEYSDSLVKNGIQKLSTLRCYYMDMKKRHFENELKTNENIVEATFLKNAIRNFLPPVVFSLARSVKIFFSASR
jgi:hypothetical protein